MTQLEAVPAQACVDPFEDLFRRHFSSLVRLGAVLGADDPADLAQEAFLRLHGRHGSLRDEASALPYLRRTVANLHASRLRHLRVARRHSRAPVDLPVPSAEESALARLERQQLDRALRRLSSRHRVVLVMRYWLDMTGTEIAQTLDLPVGTIKSQTSRALAALARHLEETA